MFIKINYCHFKILSTLFSALLIYNRSVTVSS